MYKGKRIAVVVPAYEEEGFVGAVVDTLPSFVDRAYFVDDCSPDGTFAEMQLHAAVSNAMALGDEIDDEVDDEVEVEFFEQFATDGGDTVLAERVVPICHPYNMGRGAAVKTGYRHAVADDIDVIAVMDGDGQMDPDILHEIIEPVVSGEADYAVGNRLVGPDSWKGMPPFRLFGNFALTFLSRVASGYWSLRDPQNGYTAISREALETVGIDTLYDDYGFLNDILVRLNAHDLRVVNVAMHARYGDEESGIRYSTFIPNVSMLLFRDFVWRVRTKYLSGGVHPVAMLYSLGLVAVLAVLVGIARFGFGRDDNDVGGRALIALLSFASAMLLDRRANADINYRLDDYSATAHESGPR